MNFAITTPTPLYAAITTDKGTFISIFEDGSSRITGPKGTANIPRMGDATGEKMVPVILVMVAAKGVNAEAHLAPSFDSPEAFELWMKDIGVDPIEEWVKVTVN